MKEEINHALRRMSEERSGFFRYRHFRRRTTTRHLCGECMQKMGLSLNGGEISGFLSSILSILSQSAEEKDNSPVCSGCGMHYSAFERTGRLGCAQCYHDFAEQLRPVLQRIHGNIQHEGRKPAHFEETPARPELSPLEKKKEELRLKMEEAVVSENFEDAAKYRDELRALDEQEKTVGATRNAGGFGA